MSVRAHFILYVRDQAAARRFYGAVLGCEPTLDVPGMTEFSLNDGAVLGLMPEAGIARLLGPGIVGADAGARAELYLLVEDPGACHGRALGAGARELSPLVARDWGHEAAYSLDPDGHVLAFARPVKTGSSG